MPIFLQNATNIINDSQQTGTVNLTLVNLNIGKGEDTLWFTSVQYEKEVIIITSEF